MWYRQGTVQATKNSNTVQGSSTNFVSGVRIGDGIVIDGDVYEITNVASDTHISISPPFSGSSGSGKGYAVIPVLGYDKDLSDAFNRIRLELEGYLGLLQDIQGGEYTTPDMVGEANEALTAGQFIDIVGGKIVKASNRALGFVKENFAKDETAEVFGLGKANSRLYSLSPGSRYWLGSSGNPTKTVPTSGKVQFLGVAVNATTLMTVSSPTVYIK